MPNPILIEISYTINSSIAITGLIFTFIAIGYASGAILSGIISRYISRKFIYRILLLIQIIFLIVFSLSKSLIIILISSLMIGISCGLLEAIISMITAEISDKNTTSRLNMIHVFFGLGALLGPLLSSQITGYNWNWQITYYIVAGLILINLILSLISKIPESKDIYAIENKSTKRNPIEKESNTKIIKGISFLIFLIILINLTSNITQTGYASWMPTFLRVERNVSTIFAGYSLSLLWLGLTIGRIIVSIIAKRIKVEKILFFLSITCSIFAISSVLIRNSYISLFLIFLMGLAHSGMYPGILALGSISFPQRKIFIISILTAAGASAGFFSSSFVSFFYYKYDNIQIPLVIIGLFILITFILLMVFNKKKRNYRKS